MATFNDGEQRSSIRTKINASITKTDAMDQGVATTDDVEFASVNGRDVAADGSKLDGIETGADVTDTANVTAAGALMDSELTSEASVKGLDQGVATTDSPEFAGLTVDTDTLYVDSANNGVGIGTSSPAVDGYVNLETSKNIRIEVGSAGANPAIYFNHDNFASNTSNNIQLNRVAEAMQFFVNDSERMRIDSSGHLMLGTTTPTGAPENTSTGTTVYSTGLISNARETGSANFYISKVGSLSGNAIQFGVNGSTVGSISVDTTSTSYNTSSDERLKENITDAQDASAVIDGIQVRQFDWKADGEHQRYGMIAQELDTVAPEAVTKGETEDDMWAVDYSKLVPMLVKEIQDLRKRVAELEQ